MRSEIAGQYVVVAGPDGCGKTTLAINLREAAALRLIGRHWRPGLLPALRRLRGLDQLAANPEPHARKPDPIAKATVRTVYYWLDFVLGYWFIIRPTCRKGQHFLLERGWLDMIVDPRRYGLRKNVLIRMLSFLVPRPDLLVVLDVDPALAHRRKPELSPEEIERQLAEWRGLRSGYRRRLVLDASHSPEYLAELVGAKLSGNHQ